MNGPSRFLTVAVILSALSPAALTACAMWGGDIWASLLKSGDAITLTRISQQMTCVGGCKSAKDVLRQTLTRMAGTPPCERNLARRRSVLQASSSDRKLVGSFDGANLPSVFSRGSTASAPLTSARGTLPQSPSHKLMLDYRVLKHEADCGQAQESQSAEVEIFPVFG
jgi:hypothetical protein